MCACPPRRTWSGVCASSSSLLTMTVLSKLCCGIGSGRAAERSKPASASCKRSSLRPAASTPCCTVREQNVGKARCLRVDGGVMEARIVGACLHWKCPHWCRAALKATEPADDMGLRILRARLVRLFGAPLDEAALPDLLLTLQRAPKPASALPFAGTKAAPPAHASPLLAAAASGCALLARRPPLPVAFSVCDSAACRYRVCAQVRSRRAHTTHLHLLHMPWRRHMSSVWRHKSSTAAIA